jgi:hypothetical protein
MKAIQVFFILFLLIGDAYAKIKISGTFKTQHCTSTQNSIVSKICYSFKIKYHLTEGFPVRFDYTPSFEITKINGLAVNLYPKQFNKDIKKVSLKSSYWVANIRNDLVLVFNTPPIKQAKTLKRQIKKENQKKQWNNLVAQAYPDNRSNKYSCTPNGSLGGVRSYLPKYINETKTKSILNNLSKPSNFRACRIYFTGLGGVEKSLRRFCNNNRGHKICSPKSNNVQEGQLTLKRIPSEASVRFKGLNKRYFDGITLPYGQYRLLIEHPNYTEKTVSVQVQKKQTVRNVSLNPIEVLPQKGALIISAQANARIKILGTNQRYRDGVKLPFGRYQIQIEHPEYYTEKLWVNIQQKSQQYDVKLSPKPKAKKVKEGQLVVKTNPASSVITFPNLGRPYFDGIQLKFGSYQIKVEHPGYIASTKNINVNKERNIAEVTLKPVPKAIKKGQMTINVVPQNARVSILNIKERYRDGISLEYGEYKIRVQSEGYETVEKQINLNEKIMEDTVILTKVKPKVGKLTLNVLPVESSVTFLNGNLTYRAGMEIEYGEYQITVERPGYHTRKKTIKINSADEIVKIKLKKKKIIMKPYVDSVIKLKFEPVKSLGIWVSSYEVTNEQYRKYKRSHASKSYKKYDLNKPGQPVSYISYNQANAFARWLSKQTGKNYRLPTQHEWEIAAKGGKNIKTYWGKSSAQACQYANVRDRTFAKTFKKSANFKCADTFPAATAVINLKKPNRYKLYGMLGNVAEWTCSSTESKTRCATKKERKIVYKGGSWASRANNVSTVHRKNLNRDGFNVALGFRLVRVP